MNKKYWVIYNDINNKSIQYCRGRNSGTEKKWLSGKTINKFNEPTIKKQYRVASHFYKKIQEQFQNISSTLTCFSRTKKRQFWNFDRQNLTGYQQGRSNIFWWERPNRNTPSLLPFPSSPLPGKRTLVALAGENFKIEVSTWPENTLPGSQNLILWIF